MMGGAYLLQSHAATTAISAEPEHGTITAPASIVNDANAAGGKAVGFAAAASGARDPLKQPFASNSIWNMPIGSGAQYVHANLPFSPGDGYIWALLSDADEDVIILKPTAPLTAVRYNSSGWSGADRCPGQSTTLTTVPIPSNFVVPNNRNKNYAAAVLRPDGRTIAHMQPFTRCSAGGIATSLVTYPDTDLYGDGIRGAHGGSKMSALGGSIRIGEMRSGQQGVKHAIKINVYSPRDLYNCAVRTDCFRWPAPGADTGAESSYGSENNNQNTAMKMGALLALPASVNINTMGLLSEPGRQLAWTMQNYGAYIVDSGGSPSYAISTEVSPDGIFTQQFQADFGVPFVQRVADQSPWSKDLQKLFSSLHVVNNNTATSIGGGGTPRQPLAPPIAP
jgi:hypothetical protein